MFQTELVENIKQYERNSISFSEIVPVML